MERYEHIEKLRDEIRAAHGCESRHVSTSRVRALWDFRLAWQGDVETFDLIDHPTASRCYAWTYEEGDQPRIAAVLHLPPIDSPFTAVDALVASQNERSN
jgi:hypothetical protein